MLVLTFPLLQAMHLCHLITQMNRTHLIEMAVLIVVQVVVVELRKKWNESLHLQLKAEATVKQVNVARVD